MDFKTPTWLTKEFMQNTLENGKDYKVIIEDMKINMPVPDGNNFSTDIYGIKIEYRRSTDLKKLRNKFFIIKVPIKGEMYETNVKCGIMQKETIFYNEYLLSLRSILGQDYVDNEDETTDNDEIFIAKSYDSSQEYVIILEDLKVKGYKMVDRLNQLDYEHCVVALETLAKFHAASVVLNEKNPEVVEKIGKEVVFCDALKEPYSTAIATNYGKIIERFKNHSEYERHSYWFDENKYKIWDIVEKEMCPKENELNVLNHGDVWLTNMLFKYDGDGKPISSILIDFQSCRYGTPAIDFIVLIDSSAQENVWNERMSDLIKYYVKELNSNLEKYGSTKRLKEAEFKRSIKNCTVFRICILTTTLAVVLADPNNSKLMKKERNVEVSKKTEHSTFESYLSNERYVNTLARRMEEFEKDGLLKRSGQNSM